MAAVIRNRNGHPNDEARAMSHEPSNEVVEERRKTEDGQVVLHRYLKGKLLGKVLHTNYLFFKLCPYFSCTYPRQGGFAKCYLGTAIPSKEQYALKVVLKSTLSKPKAKQKV